MNFITAIVTIFVIIYYLSLIGYIAKIRNKRDFKPKAFIPFYLWIKGA